MCIICVLLDKDKITRAEARAACWEQIQSVEDEDIAQHIRELYSELEDDNIETQD